MKRLLAVTLLLAACGSGGTETTAAPAFEPAPQGEIVIAALTPDEGGSGVISFGLDFDPQTLEVPHALTRFRRTYPRIAWSASLNRAVDRSYVTWVVVSRSESGVEESRFSADEPTDQPGVTIVANAGDLAGLLDNAPGTYVMRYFSAGEMLAEGAFTLVK